MLLRQRSESLQSLKNAGFRPWTDHQTLYGAIACGGSRHTREIGVRLALGAEPAWLRNLILRAGLASGLLGIALGLLFGAGLGRLLDSVMVGGFDAFVFGGSVFVLFATAFAASCFPARPATRGSPMTALRTE